MLQGPLTMFPPAEDNYGTDASAIICLSSTPPVVAIATCEGKLYHCVVLCEERDLNTSSSVSGGEWQSYVASVQNAYDILMKEFTSHLWW